MFVVARSNFQSNWFDYSTRETETQHIHMCTCNQKLMLCLHVRNIQFGAGKLGDGGKAPNHGGQKEKFAHV